MKLFRIVDPFTLTLVVTVLLASFFPARGGFVPFFEGLTTAAIALLFENFTVVVVGSPGSELRISDEDAITTLSTIWKKTLYGF